MEEIFGKNYFIDIDGITKKCQTGSIVKSEDGSEVLEINLFKYEIIKVCLERILNEYDDADDDLGKFGVKEPSLSFKIAFNTLIKYEILIEMEEDE